MYRSGIDEGYKKEESSYRRRLVCGELTEMLTCAT